ncbi:hypothetical protein DES52_1174 [Deinococcus yavapaiensis KR-236]|uniref:Uncharacterized protein n=1 Tax=Deinococcus yavapaiensis KR-236 TaxID=694435 RepID=A0A318S0R8_9DEIO|nr:hypothetical protein DES52_1174 [Deinococcus yavapaiensis KR-236]
MGTAVFACFTRGGNHPQDSKKEGPSTLSTSGTFNFLHMTDAGIERSSVPGMPVSFANPVSEARV